MLTEVSALPPEVSENLGLSGLLLVRATVSVLEGLDGLPKLSWLWTVIGPAVGLEVAVFFFNDTATTEIYTLSLHDALPIFTVELKAPLPAAVMVGVPALVSP